MKRFLFISLCFLLNSFTITEEWYLLETINYKILFPKKPTTSKQTINSEIGSLILNLNIYEVSEAETDDNIAYLTNETTYPESTINSDNKELLEKFFEGAVKSAVNNVNGKLLSEKKIEIGTYPGREIRIDFQDGFAIIKMRMYLVKNKIFLIETITETKKEFNKSIDKFMDSFKLKI